MLSNAIASVSKLVDGCGKYRALHKHHKCNTCGLYGHIAADCQVICSNCGGKHLQKHCIAFIADQLKTLVNSLSNSFVRDYNRTKKVLNYLEERPVVYTHVVPDSCYRLEIVSNTRVKPVKQVQKQTKFLWLDVTTAFAALPLTKRIFSKVTGKSESDSRWVLPSAHRYAAEQLPSLKWEAPTVKGRVTLEHVNFEVNIEGYHERIPNIDGISSLLNNDKHWMMLFRITFKREIGVIPVSTHTVRRGHDIEVQGYNKIKVIEHLRHKLRSYNALATDFKELEKMQAKLITLKGKRLELLDSCNAIIEKYNNIQKKYNSKKSDAINSLKEKTATILAHEKAFVKSKVKHLQKKLDNLKAKVDEQYERKEKLYGPTEEERVQLQQLNDQVMEIANHPGFDCETHSTRYRTYKNLVWTCTRCKSGIHITPGLFGNIEIPSCIQCRKCRAYNYPKLSQ